VTPGYPVFSRRNQIPHRTPEERRLESLGVGFPATDASGRGRRRARPVIT
jgi:hypothetical protein